MTREEALKGMDFAVSFRHNSHRPTCHFSCIGLTLDPAYASFTENILGTISIGKRADYVVLSQDIMKILARRILDTEVLATVIDGRPIYGAV